MQCHSEAIAEESRLRSHLIGEMLRFAQHDIEFIAPIVTQACRGKDEEPAPDLIRGVERLEYLERLEPVSCREE